MSEAKETFTIFLVTQSFYGEDEEKRRVIGGKNTQYFQFIAV